MLNKDIYNIHSDHLDTPRAVSDKNRQVLWKWEGDAFGDVQPQVEHVKMPLRMAGQYADEEVGLFYNYFRFYDPATGRYIENDPIDLAGGLNRYAYVNGNPLLNTDFYGLAVYICSRPINVLWVPSLASKYMIPNHTWIKTDSIEAGMGGDCPMPGQGCADVPYVTQTKVIDHSGQSNQAGASCQLMNNVDEQCVNNQLKLGTPTGTWHLFNQCQSFSWSLVQRCRTGIQQPGVKK